MIAVKSSCLLSIMLVLREYNHAAFASTILIKPLVRVQSSELLAMAGGRFTYQELFKYITESIYPENFSKKDKLDSPKEEVQVLCCERD